MHSRQIVILAAALWGWLAWSDAQPARASGLTELEQALSLEGRFPQVYRISFQGPINLAQKHKLQQAGIEVLEAHPPDGYLVRLPAATRLPAGMAATLEALPLAAKLSAELDLIAEGQRMPGGPLTLRAVTLRGRSIKPVAESVRGLVPPKATFLPVQGASGRGHLWLRVGPKRLVETIESLAAHPDVIWVEVQQPLEFKNDNSSWLIQSGREEEGRTIWRQGLTGWGQVVGIADSGLDADACQFRRGLDRSQVTEAISFPQPPAAIVDRPDNKVITYYVVGSADAYDDASGGYHGTHTVGDVAGDNYEHLATETAAGHDAQDGMAPGAQIVFQDIGAENGSLSGLMGVPMYDLLLQAYDTGVRVHNNSYGSAFISVNYDSDSASIDQATWEMNDLLVVFAAGNSGADNQGNLQTKSLGGTGSTAKNSLVVGASGPVELSLMGSTFRLADDLLFFSSQGPTADSRLKPDLVAPGMVFSATSNPNTAINLGCCDVQNNDKVVSNNEDDNCNVDTNSPTFGTSFSAPIAAGGAALVRQYFFDGFWNTGRSDPARGFNPTNALVKATMIASATPLPGVIVGMGTSDNLTAPPSFEQGWGRVQIEDALWFEGEQRHSLVLDDVPNPTPSNPMFQADLAPFDGGQPLTTGDEHEWILPEALPDEPTRIVLVWSDPAATPGAPLTLVNDLDLSLEAPNGDIYMGNKEYDGLGYSQPVWQPKRDEVNNLEVITLKTLGTGWHKVKVSALDVPGNGQEGSDAQGYALFVTGGFVAPQAQALEPNKAAPGETLQDVQLTGEHFVPGMQLDLGTGLTIEGLEVIDPETAVIASLTIADDAAKGKRNGTLVVYHSLTSSAADLLSIESGSAGCSCSSAGQGNASGLALVLVLLGLALAGRREF